MSTPNKPAYRLTFQDAIDVWLRIWAGEYQYRIAASYDINQGRVADVVSGRLHAGSETAARKIRAA